MTIAITVTIIIILLLEIIIIIIVNNIDNNNNDNVNKNEAIWMKKCFLRFCIKSFKLSAFFNVFEIWFQNEGPMKGKAFWPVFIFWKGCLSFKKLFLKLILPSGANSKTSFK